MKGEGGGGGEVHEADAHAADKVITHSVLVVHLNLQPVVTFNHVEASLLVPIWVLAAAFDGLAAPCGAGVEA